MRNPQRSSWGTKKNKKNKKNKKKKNNNNKCLCAGYRASAGVLISVCTLLIKFWVC